MKVTYTNLTDNDDPDNDRVIESAEEAAQLTEPSRYRVLPFAFWLVSDDGRRLTVGLDGAYGQTCYEPTEDGPYLLAVHPPTARLGLDTMVIMVGGTATPGQEGVTQGGKADDWAAEPDDAAG